MVETRVGQNDQLFVDPHRQYLPFLQKISAIFELDCGVDEMAKVTPLLWLPWMMAVFGGGERTMSANVEELKIDGLPEAVRSLVGNEVTLPEGRVFDYREGRLAQQIQELYDSGVPGADSRFRDLSVVCARFMGVLGSALIPSPSKNKIWHRYVPTMPHTAVEPAADGTLWVTFQDSPEKYVVEEPVSSIVTYGPGMTGAYLAGKMAISTTKTEYHFVSGGIGGLFVNQIIADEMTIMDSGFDRLRAKGELDQYTKLGIHPDDIRMPRAHFYADGIADAVGRISQKTIAQNEPVDVALMSDVHLAGAPECLAGVSGAYELLREGGVLVVKAPHSAIRNEGGLDVVEPLARQLFGKPVKTGECGLLSQYTDPDQPRARRAGFAIYRK